MSPQAARHRRFRAREGREHTMNVADALMMLFVTGWIITAFGTINGWMYVVYAGFVVIWHAVFGSIALYMS